MDTLRPACFIAALNLRMATQGPPSDKLNMYKAPVGVVRAGSLGLLTAERESLSREVWLLELRNIMLS